jgi:hypothetical protein
VSNRPTKQGQGSWWRDSVNLSIFFGQTRFSPPASRFSAQARYVGCWAHCRRYFFKALASDPERAKAALAYVAALFRIERAIANEARKKKEEEEKSRPIVRDFFAWCRAEQDLVVDDSPMDTAIGYALNQQQARERFLEDGRLPMTNNISERNLRKKPSVVKIGCLSAPKMELPPTLFSSP